MTAHTETALEDLRFETLLTDRLGQSWKARRGSLLARAEGQVGIVSPPAARAIAPHATALSAIIGR